MSEVGLLLSERDKARIGANPQDFGVKKNIRKESEI